MQNKPIPTLYRLWYCKWNCDLSAYPGSVVEIADASFFKLPSALLLVFLVMMNLGGCSINRYSDNLWLQQKSKLRPCEGGKVCMAIPGLNRNTTWPKKKEDVVASAVPNLLQMALIDYPEIEIIPNGELWKALRSVYPEKGDWIPANLFKPEVLQKAGANFVYEGYLYEDSGSVQLVGAVRGLGTKRWASGNLVSKKYSEKQPYEMAESYALTIAKALAKEKLISYRSREFVSTMFCDESPNVSSRSQLYTVDIPQSIEQHIGTEHGISIKFVETNECVTPELAPTVAKQYGADGVILGAVRFDAESGQVEIETQVFLADLDFMQKIGLDTSEVSSYLEQKYKGIERLKQFIDYALNDKGDWLVADLQTPAVENKLLDRADKLIADGKLEAAKFALGEALLSNADSAVPRVRLARILLTQARTAQALKEAERVVKAHPGLADGYRTQGQAQFLLGNYDAAKTTYTKLAMLEPESAEAYLSLGDIAVIHNQQTEAIGMYKRGAELGDYQSKKKLANLYRAQSMLYFWDSQFLKAYKSIDLAIRSDPNPSAELYYQRGRFLAWAIFYGPAGEGRDYGPALKDYKKSFDLYKSGRSPTFVDASGAHLEMQELYILGGKYEKAAKLALQFLINEDNLYGNSKEEKFIAQLHRLVALDLAGKEHKKESDMLQSMAKSGASARSDWTFKYLKEYVEQHRETLSDADWEFLIKFLDG